LLPLLLKFEGRSHLPGAEQDRPRAFFGPELLYQLSATLALLLLVPESLEVIAKPFHHFLGLLVYRLVDDGSELSHAGRRVPASRRTAR
jgi:hypothetical protein